MVGHDSISVFPHSRRLSDRRIPWPGVVSGIDGVEYGKYGTLSTWVFTVVSKVVK